MIIMERDCLCQYCTKSEKCQLCKHLSAMMHSLYNYGPTEMAVMFQVMRCPEFIPNEKYKKAMERKE